MVAPIEDKTASIVVPMLLPKTKAAESFQLIEPVAAIVKIIAVKALEEWMRLVKTAPIQTPTMIPENPQSVMLFIKLTDSGFNERVSPSKSKPKNNIPKPRKRSEKFLIFDFFNDFRKKPIPINGIAIADTLKEKPKNETIHAVTVVPMFAPKMIPMACVKERICAFTKLTTITVVALDD